jgi:hypothetical protein
MINGSGKSKPGSEPRPTSFGPGSEPAEVTIGPGSEPSIVTLGPGSEPNPVELGPGSELGIEETKSLEQINKEIGRCEEMIDRMSRSFENVDPDELREVKKYLVDLRRRKEQLQKSSEEMKK